MGISKIFFGENNHNDEIFIFTLENKNGLEVKILNYGGIITSVRTPDSEGTFRNIVLGFEDLEPYLQPNPYFGALIGRYGNRIAKGRFNLFGKKYQLSVNDGENHLHGGINGFHTVVWEPVIENDHVLKLSYLSPDGEEGYPGNLNVHVTYELTDQNELHIDYQAVTDKSTPVNLTAHSYFNLSGDPSKSILNHQVKLHANEYTPVNDQLIPTGNIQNVVNTPFDFSDFKPIGKDIEKVDGGYDHNFIAKGEQEMCKVFEGFDPETRRKLSVITTEPGFQFYSGNFLDGTFHSPEGTPYKKYSGFCIEPQHFPNSPNEKSFPSTILHPNEKYNSKTIYQFGLQGNTPD